MKASLLKYICCPNCGGDLTIKEISLSNEDKVIEGFLQCLNCSLSYPICKGMPYLIVKDKTWQLTVKEAQGWVSLWRKKGMYDNPTLEDSFRLPYVGGIWTDVARMFDLALQEMDLKGGECILDLGAGQGWASRYFAEKGCTVMAVDIVDCEWYGLGRSWAIMDYAGVYFEPIIADGEKLPFPPETFDFVFLCGTLHHFRKFEKVLKEIKKVLKPGGRIIAAGEPSISIFSKEKDIQAMLEETKEGITERRPKVFQYWWAFKKAGFKDIQIDTFETYKASPEQIYTWIIAVRQNFFRLVRPWYKPMVWVFLSSVLFLPPRLAAMLILWINGGNLFIRARI